jgi:hypothetical protein
MKVQFNILSLEVEKLYQKQLSSEKEIDQHIEFIHDFVVSCGYTWDEYLELSLKNNSN